MTYISREKYEAVQVVPENFATLYEWGVDFTGPTLQLDGMWVVRSSLNTVVAIVSPEDFEAQFEMVDSGNDTNGETN